VFADLVVAVNIGVILATLHFLRRMSMTVEVLPQDERQIGVELIQQGLMKLPAGVLVYSIEGPFFFGAVENFGRVLAETHTDPKVLVIRLLRVPFVDMTGLQALQEAIGELQQRGVRVLLCEANAAVMGKMERAGLLATLGRENYCVDLSSALTRADAFISV
jgi:SulP family sulfate permease